MAFLTFVTASQVCLTLLLALFVSRFWALFRNYLVAHKIGMPILVTPASWHDPWWNIISPLLYPLRTMPFCAWIGYATAGWPLHDKYETHQRLGPAFVVVSPRAIDVYVADPGACIEILSSWSVFIKPPKLFRFFNIFGKNVMTVNGDNWQRHRKLAAYGFKESISRTVWFESLRQSSGMCQDWSSKSEVSLSKVSKDFETVSLNVLSTAGFGKRYDFGDIKGLQTPDPGHQLSYGEALRTIMHDLRHAVLFDSLAAPDWILPAKLRALKLATKEFRSYLKEMVVEERENLAAGADEKANLCAVLVRANDREKEVDSIQVRGFLSDDELFGNLFMFNLAGQETTASAFSYSLPLLAVNPETQEWVAEEVDNVFDRDQDYSRSFQRLVRCMAVLVSLISTIIQPS
jgi:cytochrome P450